MNRMLLLASLMVLLLFCLGGNARGQMVQSGKVVEANSKGKALSGVYIRLTADVQDYQPTSSDAHGLFRLSFSEHQVGEKVYVIAEKSGYEVVNIHILKDGWILTDREKLIVEMAPKAKVDKERKRYYGLAEAACVERYGATMSLLDAELAQQKISMKEYQYWKLKAEDELHQSYKNLSDYADAFARVNADNTDPATVTLVEKLKANDIEGAMALVDANPGPTVMQAYSGFTVAFPMQVPEVPVASMATDTLPESDSLYNDIMVLQTYAKMFERDFATSGMKYAKSCTYLGVLYKQRGWDEASRKYFTKALKMYEMLNLFEGVEVQDKIDKIRQLLEN